MSDEKEKDPDKLTAKDLKIKIDEYAVNALAKVQSISLKMSALKFVISEFDDVHRYASNDPAFEAYRVILDALIVKRANAFHDFFMMSGLSSSKINEKARKIALRAFLKKDRQEYADLTKIADEIDIPFLEYDSYFGHSKDEKDKQILKELHNEMLEDELLKNKVEEK